MSEMPEDIYEVSPHGGMDGVVQLPTEEELAADRAYQMALKDPLSVIGPRVKGGLGNRPSKNYARKAVERKRQEMKVAPKKEDTL